MSGPTQASSVVQAGFHTFLVRGRLCGRSILLLATLRFVPPLCGLDCGGTGFSRESQIMRG